MIGPLNNNISMNRPIGGRMGQQSHRAQLYEQNGGQLPLSGVSPSTNWMSQFYNNNPMSMGNISNTPMGSQTQMTPGSMSNTGIGGNTGSYGNIYQKPIGPSNNPYGNEPMTTVGDMRGNPIQIPARLQGKIFF